jgi:hypothetical protein
VMEETDPEVLLDRMASYRMPAAPKWIGRAQS